jgi:HPt (histidine-containing phosphotransfer) domain-containing protein
LTAFTARGPDQPGKKDAVPPKIPEQVLGAAALNVIGGDRAIYKQTLNAFREERHSDYTKITESLAAGNYTEARRIVHTLKSVAVLIGAGHLSNTAPDTEPLAALEAQPSTEEPPLPESGDRHFWGRRRGSGEGPERLGPLLLSGNTASLNLIEEIRKRLLKHPDKVRLFIKQIEDFEFADALETLKVIKDLRYTTGKSII